MSHLILFGCLNSFSYFSTLLIQVNKSLFIDFIEHRVSGQPQLALHQVNFKSHALLFLDNLVDVEIPLDSFLSCIKNFQILIMSFGLAAFAETGEHGLLSPEEDAGSQRQLHFLQV